MKNVLIRYWNSQYSTEQWKWMKVPFIIIWFIISADSLIKSTSLLSPIGICGFIDCSFFLHTVVKITLVILAFIFSLMYVFEKKMVISTFILSVISVISFTLTDSQGIFNRMDVLSGILIAQFIAYLIFRFNFLEKNLKRNRIRYSQQVVVSLYFLSGLSKLFTSGLNWFQDTEGFALQIIKGNMVKEINSPGQGYIEKGEIMSHFVIENPGITSVLLATSLFLELFAFLILFNRKIVVYYGVVLILFHVGIWLFLSIALIGIVASNLIFLINIFYLSYLVFVQYKKIV